MANTAFLAQFMGAFVIIMGTSMLFRRRLVTSVFDEVFSSRAITYIVGILEVIGGVLIVLSHNIWSGSLATAVTILGWLLLIEGVIYLVASSRFLKKIALRFHNKKAYYTFAVFYILIGIYLMYASFGSQPPVL